MFVALREAKKRVSQLSRNIILRVLRSWWMSVMESTIGLNSTVDLEAKKGNIESNFENISATFENISATVKQLLELEPNETTADWFLMSSPWPTLILIFAYVVLVKVSLKNFRYKALINFRFKDSRNEIHKQKKIVRPDVDLDLLQHSANCFERLAALQTPQLRMAHLLHFQLYIR